MLKLFIILLFLLPMKAFAEITTLHLSHPVITRMTLQVITFYDPANFLGYHTIIKEQYMNAEGRCDWYIHSSVTTQTLGEALAAQTDAQFRAMNDEITRRIQGLEKSLKCIRKAKRKRRVKFKGESSSSDSDSDYSLLDEGMRFYDDEKSSSGR